MSSRKRSLRSNGSRNLRRSLPPLLESLEARLVLSTLSPVERVSTGPNAPPYGAPTPISPPGTTPTLTNVFATPGYRINMVPGPNGSLVPNTGGNPFQNGFSPQQLQGAYGVDRINFGGVQGTGAGQTIALIDAGNNTGFVPSSSPNFSTSYLAMFDKSFGIPDPPVFGMFNQTGGTTLPAPVNGWGPEIALDIEWAHAIAPQANIEIVEANSALLTDLFTAAETAVTKLGASVVSMSFGAAWNLEAPGHSSQYLIKLISRQPWPPTPM